MLKKLWKWLFNKPKKGIIKMDQTRIHYYKSLISFDKRDNIVEQIIKDKSTSILLGLILLFNNINYFD